MTKRASPGRTLKCCLLVGRTSLVLLYGHHVRLLGGLPSSSLPPPRAVAQYSPLGPGAAAAHGLLR